MKHLLILLLACTFSFPSRGQSIIQLSPLQGERGIQAAIEKASMNGSSILLHDGDYILHKSIDIKNCKKGIIIKTRVRDKDCVKNRVKRAKIVRFTLC